MGSFSKNRGYHAWITSVLLREDVEPAVVLAKSLRRVLTRAKVTCLVSPKLDFGFRKLLAQEFDQIFVVDQPSSENGNGLGAKDHAKLFCFTLQLFQKCVYLDPSSLMLRNCDEIFERYNAFNASASESSIFFFVPSLAIYEVLSKAVKKKVNFEEYVKEWMVNQEKDFDFMDAMYSRKIGLGQPPMAEEEEQVGIVSFQNSLNLPQWNKFQLKDAQLGAVELKILEHWLSIYEEVKPLIVSALDKSDAPVPRPLSKLPSHEPVAVVGMSCRYPGANNLDDFWRILIEGREAVQRVPETRWTSDHCVMMNPEARNTQASFLSVPVDEFDGKFFGISPKELEFLDPQQRFLLEVAWEALEDAAINPLHLRGSHSGVFTGAWMYDYKDQLMKAGTSEFYRTYMGNSFGAAAARLSFFLGLTGPSVATESGCSSAMVAIDLACKSIRSGETPLALACGVNLLLSPFVSDDISFVVSPDGRCKTFDASADGFGRAEGCGVLVLKRLSDAVKDGNKIWALIRGSSAAQEGLSRSMGTPTRGSEALAMKLALEDAGVEASEVDYVETHGTGTPVGDPMEIAAISDVYSKARERPLVVGSVKTNIGHTESCSAMPGIMKVILSMKHELIPAHRNLENLNPKIDLEGIPARIPDQAMAWKRSPDRPRLAGVSSFGITGTDGHMIIEEPPLDIGSSRITLDTDRPLHLLTLSAKTEEALDELIDKYEHLLSNPERQLKFADISYTANVGRAALTYRAAVIASTAEEAKEVLQSGKFLRQEVTTGNGTKVCFLFTGQGSQYRGMARSLYEGSPVFRLNFDRCSTILKRDYNIDIRHALWDTDSELLGRTIFSQTSIFVIEYSMLKLWESWGIEPDYVLGHSLGEFSAAVGARILGLEEALKLVAERSRLIDDLPGGSMLVIKADHEKVNDLLGTWKGTTSKWLDCAAINSKEQTVLAGDTEAVLEFSEFCKAKGLRSTVLEASHAFHSRHMEPMLEEYEAIAATIQRKRGTNSVKYISAVDGQLLEDPHRQMDAQYWGRHTRDKVKFLEASRVAVEEGCTLFLEVGPHPVLSALMMMNNPEDNVVCLPSIRRNQKDWEVILETLSKLYVNGLEIDWKRFDQYIPRRLVDSLPFYPFQRKKFWFEKNDLGPLHGKMIHPLLGSTIPNATSLQIFQNGLNLKSVEFLKDHCIGDRVIFPGAGYLEMCLSAGHATTQCFVDCFSLPVSPLVVEDLKILKPLLLEHGKSCQTQVVIDCGVTSSEGSGMKVQVFAQLKHDNEVASWVEHATAQFSPLASNSDIHLSKKITPDELKSAMEVFSTEEFYGKLAKIGLEFGPAFRSLHKVWKGPGAILAKTPNPPGKYITHPAVLDAMIQVAMIASSKDKPVDKLHVPIGVKKCVWLEPPKCDGDLYIYSSSKDNGSIFLYDSQGTPLAFMEGVELIQTSVQQIESTLDNYKSEVPLFWEEVYKSKGLGPWEKRVGPELLSPDSLFSKEFATSFLSLDDVADTTKDMEKDLDKLVYNYILRALYALGWHHNGKTLEVGTVLELNEMISSLSILTQHSQFLHYFMSILEEEGILEGLEDNHWRVIKLPPEEALVQEEISRIHVNLKVDSVEEFQTLKACGGALAKVLKGEDNGPRILFPEDPKSPSAAKYYTGFYTRRGVFEMIRSVVHKYLEPFGETKSTLRILEVGAGTGSFASQMFALMEELKLSFDYTYTDISPAFFLKAESKFDKYKGLIHFKPLNIEVDPSWQGFCPGYYDIVIAGDVIHATKSLRTSMSHVRKLLRPQGCCWLLECTKVNRETTLVFGLLEGYWYFNDYDIRPNHSLVAAPTWEGVMRECGGFSETSSITCFDGSHGLIFGRAQDQVMTPITNEKRLWLFFLPDNSRWREATTEKLKALFQNSNKTAVVVERGDGIQKSDLSRLISQLTGDGAILEGVIYGWGLLERDIIDQGEISRPYLHLLQILAESHAKKAPKVLVLSEGIIPTLGDCGPCNPSSGTLWGITKSFHNEYPGIISRLVDLSMDDEVDTRIQQIFSEVWIDDSETMVAYREGKRLCSRFVPASSASTKPLSLPPSGDRFQLILPSSKSFADLKFGPLPPHSLSPNQVEIRVKATALNFRDILTVLKPTAYFESFNKIGLDIAGVVTQVGGGVTKWKPGDSVFGANVSDKGALESHVCLEEDSLVALPESFTFTEAVTLPAVFATSYYALYTIAHLRKGETVLIHTGSGGVGLCAIQIAQYIGANIISTAGSTRKRAYLKGLGVEHVFHSRNTTYEQDILRVTSGKGVDVVLNSLTSPGFKEATLNACAKNARFVEMSKLSVWTSEEVTKLRPDVKYTIIDLTTCSKEVWNVLNEKMDDFLKSGIARPIPYTRFDATRVPEALTFLQKASHIGKIVCTMPEFRFDSGRRTTVLPLFNDRSTYLITGGLGGIGLETAKWMTTQGAKHLVLVGRHEPNEVAAQVIHHLNSKGNQVQFQAADVGNFQQCQRLVEFIRSTLPPLRGIMHLSGVLQDSIITNQTWDKYEATYSGKVRGTWNLHELTRNDNLEYFVMFSSIAGLLGPPGQSNHAASNAFLDAFTHFRRSQGLAATTVNWGPWADVGVAVGKEFVGAKSFSSQRGINALDLLLREQRTQVCVAEIQMSVFQKLFQSLHTYLEEVLNKELTSNGKARVSAMATSEKFWKDFEGASDGDERVQVIKDSVKGVLREILKLDRNERIDDKVSFQDLGLDSLMMVEMKNLLQGILGKRVTLSANDLKDCNNIELIAERLHDMIGGQTVTTPVIEKMSDEEFQKLIRTDSQLPSHIRALESNEVKNIEDCKTFLLTGATGALGPYILRYLLDYVKDAKVYCLIRGKSHEVALKKLEKTLRDLDLWSKIEMSRVSCVVGDMSVPKFGLEEKDYESLATEVDAVIHCAVKANHVEMYRKCESRSSIRNVNVNGTLSILEFAARSKTKHVLHASTILAVTSMNDEGQLWDGWPEIGDFDGVTQLGYPVSKFISDLFMKTATQERGIPCKAFRFPAITGDSVTGRFGVQPSHIILRMLSYIQVRAMPSVPIPLNVVPVDICAKIALSIFLNPEAPSDIYNVSQLQPEYEQAVVSVMKDFGFDVDVVDFPEFASRLDKEGEGSLLYAFRDIYLDEDLYTSLFFAPKALQGWFINYDGFFHSEKLMRFAGDLVREIPSTGETMKKDLTFAKEIGIFDKLGVK